jgi:hypothetical protein
MNKHRLRIIAAMAALLLISAGAGLFAADQATARTRTWGDHEEGEVVVNGQVVMRIRTAAGGYSATTRAEQVADRLNKSFGEGMTWQDFRVGEMNGETAVLDKRGELIVTADRFHAQANGTTPFLLARAWDTNLVQALGGQPEQVAAAASGQGAAATGSDAAGDVSWERQSDKIVPIFSIGTPGISIGAARVVGPSVEVGRVKAVAQVEAQFQDVVRAHIYIPVASISTKIDRVQGASVEALIDYNMPF